MKKLALIATIFITVASFFALPAPVSAADYDHGGANWTPSGTISGVQFNINTLTITGTVTVSGSVEIHCQTADINGTLTATGQGNPAGTGTGAGTAGDKNDGAGGGGYGGAGGDGESGYLGGVAYGSSLAPIDMGSGGGSSVAQAGGSGGGAIIIHCIGTFTIGTTGAEVIEADGTAGGTDAGAYAAGGGSGGSIYISAATFTGGLADTTHIHADGGAGGDGGTGDGGGGGGGRIAIHCTSSTYAGLTSAAGGIGPGTATDGAPGTDVTGTALWRTYKGGYTVYDDVFSDYATEHDVYVEGTGFPAGDYTIVFWDALEVKIQVVTGQTGPDIQSMRIFARDPDDPAGTWYASVYPDGSVPATSHSETANLQADYAFYVYASAIPEFPTIMAAIGVAGLCFGIYWWMRRRVHRVRGVH